MTKTNMHFSLKSKTKTKTKSKIAPKINTGAKLVASYSKRLEAVIAAKGAPTKY